MKRKHPPRRSNWILQPNGLHPDNARHNVLVTYRHAWSAIIALTVPTGAAVALLVVPGLPKALRPFWRTGDWSADLLPLATGLSALLLVWVATAVSVLPNRPRRYQTQTFSVWPRVVVNWLLAVVILLVMASLLIPRYEALTEALVGNPITEVQLKANRRAWVIEGGLMALIIVGGALPLQWALRVGLRYFRSYWTMVRLTAYFDREAYQPGDVVGFSFKHRQSTDDRKYRLHLNFVREDLFVAGERQYVKRNILWDTFTDYTAKQLDRGVRLQLPKNKNTLAYLTRRSSELPLEYWEVLVEAHDRPTYARFFVNVR